jgi:acyl-coenzyme A thioesterase PaaI-like protein
MKMINFIKPNSILKLMSWWPPFLAAGIKIKSVNANVDTIEVEMNLSFYNTNYVGSHFGGSLYAMCDPFFMFILLHHLGKDHIVWDKAAGIDFIRPGKGKVRATFHIPLQKIEDLKERALKEFKLEPIFDVEVLNSQDEVVAKIKKTLYIRRKDAKTRFSKDK